MWFYLQALWAPGSQAVFFIGWYHEPFRLGLKFCSNRRLESCLQLSNLHLQKQQNDPETCECFQTLWKENVASLTEANTRFLYTYTFKTYFFTLCLWWSKLFQVSLVQDWSVWTLWWEHSLCLFVNILKLCPHFAQLALSSSKPERLSGENLSVSNPRLSPDGSTLIYLQGAVFGPHNQCLSLQQVLYVCSCMWGFCACLCVLSLNGWLRTDSWIILHSWIWKAGRHLRCWMLSAGHRLVR